MYKYMDLKSLRLIYFLLLLYCPFFTSRKAFAQDGVSHFAPVQFQENKGQWAKPVLYRGDVQGGHIFLRNDGFTISLLNQQDITRIDNYYHGKMAPVGVFDSMYVKGPGHNNNTSGNTLNATKATSARDMTIHGHAYQINFLGANPHPAIEADHASETYYNYLIGNDSTKWGRHVHAYEGVTYHQLYANVDMRVYSQASQLKYDLIIYPGGRPDIVNLAYKGLDKMTIEDHQLVLKTSLGDVIEQEPYAYQYINNQKVEVPCEYQLDGNKVSFKVSGKYDNNYPLIIDPTFIFCTFTGSTADNWGFTATYDEAGDFYTGGIVFGLHGSYPATTGAFQTNFGGGNSSSVNGEGGFDMAISKFGPQGRNLIYATYLGGSSDDQPHSLIADYNERLIVAGRSQSKDYPLASNSPNIGHSDNGDWDIVVSELSADGSSLVGSVKMGGTKDDGVNINPNKETGTQSLMRNYGDDARSEVVTGDGGNIYLASCTQSIDFPTVKPFQDSSRGGQDGVIIKFNSDLSKILWSSYLGGSGNDASYVVEMGNKNNIYVAGGTASSDLHTTSGVIMPSYQGGDCDGFIADIQNDGSKINRLTYLGTPKADEIYGIQLDDDGNVYVGGSTEGTWTVTANAKYSGINTQGKQFVSKLKPDLSSYIYSTVFGASNATASSYPNISLTAFLVDKCQHVYYAGWGGRTVIDNKYHTSGTNGLPVTANALKSTTDGNDFYFFVLDKDAKGILFASYFGQNGGFTDHVDGGTSRFDRNGTIYEAICANCNDQVTFPTGPPGVYSRTNPSGGRCNLAALKIAFNLAGVSEGLKVEGDRYRSCVDSVFTFIDSLRHPDPVSYKWVASDNPSDTTNTTVGRFQHAFTALGTYQVTMIVIDPASCNYADTGYVNVTVADNPAKVGFDVKTLSCVNGFSYKFTNTSQAVVSGSSFSANSFNWDFGDGTTSGPVGVDYSPIHKYATEGSYPVTLHFLDQQFCNAPQDIVDTVVAGNVVAGIGLPPYLCVPSQVTLANTTTGGKTYAWTLYNEATGNTVTSSEMNPVYNFDLPFGRDTGTVDIQLIAYNDNSCNGSDTVRGAVLMYAKPQPAFTIIDQARENQPFKFTNQTISPEVVSYIWSFGDGDTLVTSRADTLISHLYTKAGTYNVCLTAVNKAGCDSTVCQAVEPLVKDALGVPNAFSPTGEAINQVIKVKGFGIDKMDWKIYNRWGQLVFESNDPNIGWNGYYKGKLQEMDVYTYILSVTFSDGKTVLRKGDITLIR